MQEFAAIQCASDVSGSRLQDAILQSDRKQGNETSFLDSVLNQMPSGVVIAEAPSGRLICWNRQAETILLRSFPATAAALYLADGDQEELVLSSHRNLKRETVDLLHHLRFDAPMLPPLAFKTGEPQVVEDTYRVEPKLEMVPLLAQHEDARSILAVPVVTA